MLLVNVARMSSPCRPADTLRGAALVVLRWLKTLAVLCCEEGCFRIQSGVCFASSATYLSLVHPRCESYIKSILLRESGKDRNLRCVFQT